MADSMRAMQLARISTTAALRSSEYRSQRCSASAAGAARSSANALFRASSAARARRVSRKPPAAPAWRAPPRRQALPRRGGLRRKGPHLGKALLQRERKAQRDVVPGIISNVEQRTEAVV